jgi:hypothetical protein
LHRKNKSIADNTICKSKIIESTLVLHLEKKNIRVGKIAIPLNGI